jgi:CheY-like chemotaxis protein
MKRILVVDDEEDVLFVLKKTLTARGYSVITAMSGTYAMALAEAQRPDLIILDVAMPEMDGGEVSARLQEHPSTRSIPVIFLTALLSKTEESQRSHLIDGKITLAKPIDMEELLAQMEGLLGSCPSRSDGASRESVEGKNSGARRRWSWSFWNLIKGVRSRWA